MKRLCFAVLLFVSLVFPPRVSAQNTLSSSWESRTANGSITAASTSCTGQSCVWIVAPKDTATASIQLSGTFTATVQFEQSVDGSTWTAATTTSGATSATAAGIYPISLYGVRFVRVRSSAFTSGPVVVAISTAVSPGATWYDDGVSINAPAGRTVNVGSALLGVTYSGLSVTVASGSTPLADGSSFAWTGKTITLPANQTLYLMADLDDGTVHALPFALNTGSLLLGTVVTGASSVTSVKTPLRPVLPYGYVERTKAALKHGQVVRVALMGDSLTEGAGTGTYWYSLLFDTAQAAAGFNVVNAANVQYDNYAVGGSTSHYGLAVIGRGWYGSSGLYGSTALGFTPVLASRYLDPPPGFSESPVLKGYDLVILNYGSDGGTAERAYMEAIIRDVRRSGAECIIHTGNNRTDNSDFADPLGMGWKVLAEAYGCAIADTWSYEWEQEFVYGTNAHADVIHPNQAGHNAYASALKSVLNSLTQQSVDVWPLKRARVWHDLTSALWQRKMADMADVQFTPFTTTGAANTSGAVTTAAKNPAIAFGGKTGSNYITQLTTGQFAWFSHPMAQSIDLLIDNSGVFTADIRTQNGGTLLGTVSGGADGSNRMVIVEGITVGSYADMSTGQPGLYNRGVEILCTSGTLKLVAVVFHTAAYQEIPLESAPYTFTGTWAMDTTTTPNLRYTDTAGDFVTIPFRGCGLAGTFNATSSGGVIDFWVDGSKVYSALDLNTGSGTYVYSLFGFPLSSLDWWGDRGCGQHVAKIKLSSVDGGAAATSNGHHRLGLFDLYVIGDRQ